MSENSFLQWLRQELATDDPSVVVGSGADDCALINSTGNLLAITTDTYVEGTHFLSTDHPELVGSKAILASLSDLAASACQARWLLLSVVVNKNAKEEWVKSLTRGMINSAKKYSTNIVGGDTTSGDKTVITVTALGEPLLGGLVLRSGAIGGDAVFVTGRLGGSILGKHLQPIPRLREISLISLYLYNISIIKGENNPLHAAMDISDGLALDISRLCKESKVGVELLAKNIPISSAAKELSKKTGIFPLEHALGDGEDFELILAVDNNYRSLLENFWQQQLLLDSSLPSLTYVGNFNTSQKLTLRYSDSEVKELPPAGYEHKWSLA